MLSAVIIDDDTFYAAVLKDTVCQMGKNNGLEIRIDVYKSPQDLLESTEIYDIYFFDIELPIMSGIELAKQLRERYIASEFIFVSAHDSYMRAVMQVKPSAYIRKSFLIEDLEEAFGQLARTFSKKEKQLILKDNNKDYIISVKELVYIKSKEHYVYLYDSRGEKKIIRNKLSIVEQQVRDYDFLRVHSRYIVNLNYVADYCKSKIFLKNGEEIGVSKTFQKNSELVLCNWLSKRRLE